jgi:Carboxypeptidase regulatory-like domain
VSGNGVTGALSGTLATDEVRQVTVPLQATGSIAGTVFAPDGQTPVGDAHVIAYIQGVFSATVDVNADGTFRFDNLPLRSYNLQAKDSSGRLRAVINGIALSANGQVVNQPLTFVGLGNVTGRVLNPDSSSAPNMVVQVHGLNPTFGGYFSATTNAAGFYEVDGVPVGAFAVTTGDTSRLLLGEGSGTITADGQVVNVDILLQSNAVNLPYAYLYDANEYYFDVQRDASIAYPYVFAGGGAPLLDIVANGTATRFTGATIGTFENQKQSIAVRQQGVDGLDVTRKVFVPNAGYFARYLDVLSNPTANPITVDVRVTSNFQAYSGSNPTIVTTSSGDATLSLADGANPDRWLVVDDDVDADYGSPAVSLTFDGPGASRPVDSAQFTPAYPYYYGSQVVHAWTNVTVPPGGTVAFMYFLSEETSRAAAAAAAERLVQAPPEALSGLSLSEIQAIQNFVVPQDGIGTVAPLPPLTGVVTGHVYDIDGVTPLVNSQVTFTSGIPLFAPQTVNTNASGMFTFAGVINATGSSKAIPADAFTLQAKSPFSGAVSQSVPGAFASGQTTAAQDVVFANTSTIVGTVRRTSGAVVTSGSLSLTGSGLPFGSMTGSVRTDGTFSLSGVPPGTYTLTVTVNNPQGTAWTTSVGVTTVAGQPTAVNVVMPATGTVQGVVSRPNGVPSVGARVVLRDATYAFQRSATADTSGAYTLADVPVGQYVIDYTEPRTNVTSTTAPFSVVQDQATVENLIVVAVGTVQVQVSYARGVPASGALVYLNGPGTSKSGTTDATGTIVFSNVAAGTLTVQARHPGNQTLIVQSTVTITTEGDVQTVPVTLPAAGTVSGHVTYGNGNAAVSAEVDVVATATGSYILSGSTNASGDYSFGGVPVGQAFSVRVHRPYPYYNLFKDLSATPFTDDGQLETVNGVVPALATVRVTALQFDGTPLVGARVEWQDTSHPYFQFAAYTDASGRVSIANVQEGAFAINVRDPNTYALLKQVSGTIQSTDEGLTIDVSVQMLTPRGSIQGTVFAADGTTPVPNGYVYLYNASDGSYLTYASVAADGTYQFANVQVGDSGFIVQAYSPTGNLTVSQAGSFTAQGQVVTVNLSLPIVQGNIQGVIFAADGVTPVPNASVELDSTDLSSVDSTSADQNGAYQFLNEWVPVGGFLVQSRSPDDYATMGSQAGVVATNGQTVQVNVSVPIVQGSIGGVVYAGDGVTPVPYASLRVTSQNPANSEAGLDLYTEAGVDGSYQFRSFYSGLDGFVLTATTSDGFGRIDTLGTFSTQGEQATFDIPLPVSVVKGQLTFSDGSVPDPANSEVFVTGSDGATYYGGVIDTQGHYVVLGAPVGDIQVTGVDDVSGLTTTVASTIASVSSATVVDLVLPASGTITGQVIGLDGNPVAGASVVLVAEGLAFQRYTTADSTGHFSFDHVSLGASYLQTQFFDTHARYASATATLTTDGETVAVTIDATAADGQVVGHVLTGAGDPVANASVRVDSFGSIGPYGHFATTITTDTSGAFSVEGMPQGPIHLVATDPANSQNVGVMDGPLSGPTASMDVTLGTGIQLPLNLDGADGFRYDVAADGELTDGGTVDRSLNDAYDGAYRLLINGAGFGGVGTGRLDLSSRGVVLGPEAFGNVLVTRRIFVPAGGGFVRYLEVLSNPTNVDQSIQVTVQSNLGSGSSTRVVVSPAATGNTYAVTDQDGICCDPALGHVFSGASPPLAPVSVTFGNAFDLPSYGWQLPVPANGTVIIMHFGLQRDPGDPNVAATAAQTLRDLLDPDELTGISAADEARIRNFVVPQQ